MKRRNNRMMDTLNFPGVAINKGFFPVLVPVGVTGNVLSFLVREYNNRSPSFCVRFSQ